MRDAKQGVEDDCSLIQRIAAKDVQALETFYKRHNRVAFSLVLRVVGIHADAEDVLVDVFWQVWQHSGKYDASRGKPLGWLLTIARTRAIDCLRTSGRQRMTAEQIESQAAPPADADSYVVADTRRAVREALDGLSEQQRVPLEMAYFQGMSHTEIATALHQPLGTIKDRISTGMMHLRKRLKSYL